MGSSSTGIILPEGSGRQERRGAGDQERSIVTPFRHAHGHGGIVPLRLPGHLDGQVGGANVIRFLQDHGALHGVLQFAHISRPIVLQQQVAGLLRDAFHRLAKTEIVTLDEEFDERENILLAMPQGRNEDGDDAEPVEQVLAKGPIAHALLQIAIGGGDDADIHADILHAADAADGLILQRPQQFRLQVGGELADFIQEERAAVGDFKQPLLLRLGVGEGAALVPEELGFHQGFGNGRAVDGRRRACRRGRCRSGWPWRPSPCRCRSRPE